MKGFVVSLNISGEPDSRSVTDGTFDVKGGVLTVVDVNKTTIYPAHSWNSVIFDTPDAQDPPK